MKKKRKRFRAGDVVTAIVKGIKYRGIVLNTGFNKCKVQHTTGVSNHSGTFWVEDGDVKFYDPPYSPSGFTPGPV